MQDAKLPTSSDTRDGGMLESVAQGVSTDHACRTHDGNTCSVRRRNVHSHPAALETAIMLLILKDLPDVRGDKVCFRNPMGVTSDRKVIDRSCIALCCVINQPEMDGNRVLTV